MPPLNTTKPPQIAILCWEAGFVPRGLLQLEKLPGNSTNPSTFDFPVKYCRIKGANIESILEKPCPHVLKTMIEESQKLEKEGIGALTTSCGFNAIFQKELRDAVTIPVFTSSLLQIPLLQNMLGKEKKIGVITAKKSALNDKHFKSAGITDLSSLKIEGLETCAEWNKIFSSPDEEINIQQVKKDILNKATSMMKDNNIGAFVLECTDLPPFSAAIKKATGLPVFDFVSLTNYVYQGISQKSIKA